jgi:hypothetical protein
MDLVDCRLMPSTTDREGIYFFCSVQHFFRVPKEQSMVLTPDSVCAGLPYIMRHVMAARERALVTRL